MTGGKDWLRDLLRWVVDQIDREFSPGYAERHPELIAAIIQSDAIHNASTEIAGAIESVAGGVNGIASNMVTPEVGAALHGLAALDALGSSLTIEGMDDVADAIDPEGKRHEWKAKLYAIDEANKANGGKDGPGEDVD